MGGARHRSSAEDNYAAFELEMLALKRAFEHLQPLISSNPFTTVWKTDSQTAASFKHCQLDGKSAAMRKFVADMQHVDLKIELISGSENAVADAVSRFNHYHHSPPVNICVLDTTTTPITPTPSSPPHTPPTESMTSAPASPVSERALPPSPPDAVPRGVPALPPAAAMQADEDEEIEVLLEPTSATPAAAIASPTSVQATSSASIGVVPFDDLDEQIKTNIAKLIEAQRADASLAAYWNIIDGTAASDQARALQPCVDDNGILRVRPLNDRSQTVIAAPA
jgi:hypothetical protein